MSDRYTPILLILMLSAIPAKAQVIDSGEVLESYASEALSDLEHMERTAMTMMPMDERFEALILSAESSSRQWWSFLLSLWVLGDLSCLGMTPPMGNEMSMGRTWKAYGSLRTMDTFNEEPEPRRHFVTQIAENAESLQERISSTMRACKAVR